MVQKERIDIGRLVDDLGGWLTQAMPGTTIDPEQDDPVDVLRRLPA